MAEQADKPEWYQRPDLPYEAPKYSPQSPTQANHAEALPVPSHTANGKFAPGNRVNPGGRPRSQFSPTALLREIVEERKGSFVYKLYEQADAGDFRSQELVMAYLDGKPVQRSIEITATAEMDSLVAGLRSDLASILPPAEEPDAST